MIGRFGLWRHVVVLLVIGACAAMGFLGLLGGRGERFDAKQVTVSPGGGQSIAIREVVDEDFGDTHRHGYQRAIPDDFGTPTKVSASSPDANADVGITPVDFDHTRIRLGDPNTTFTGQHRYVLNYTYPNANLSSGLLNLDIIGTDETLETHDFVVVVTGFRLQSPSCDVGKPGAVGGCTLLQTGDGEYRTEFTPLAKGDGITIKAQIVGFTTPSPPALPPLPKRAVSHRVELGLGIIGIGLLTAIVVLVGFGMAGRDEVAVGGAADAAYGATSTSGQLGAAVKTRRVFGKHLERMSTIEFVPPKGLVPWQGNVLLRERIDDDTVAAWFSALAAQEGIVLVQDHHHLVITMGPKCNQLDPNDQSLLMQAMGGRQEFRLGKYDPVFASAWLMIKQLQGSQIAQSGWWRKHTPRPNQRRRAGAAVVPVIFIVAAAAGFAIASSFAASTPAIFHVWSVALAFGFLMTLWVSIAAYKTLLPARSASGSAEALLTESFRKFLHASEGQHVEWAWKQGVLREYSAWAVALGAAEAWGKALAHSNVPQDQQFYASNPLYIHTYSSSFSHTHTAPSSSGSGGGGGGGGVGGGGGGGSSGSW